MHTSSPAVDLLYALYFYLARDGRVAGLGDLDLERAREIFEASHDFTVGLEEEFALVDPDSLELVHRFEELRAACEADEVLAESAAGELIDTEIEIRSGRAESFADAVELPARAPRGGCSTLAERLGIGARRHRHPPVGELPRPADHRHRALQPPARGAALGGAAQQHLEPARPRGRPRRRPRDRRLRPPARSCCRRCWRLSANSPFLDGRDTGLHLGAHRDLHPHLPALRRPRAVRRLGRVRGLHRAADATRDAWSSRPSCGGACAPTTRSARSRCGSATPRRAATRRSRSPA